VSALERIAELHSGKDGWCQGCSSKEWPCPTRRLCDEAAREAACADSATDALGVFLRVAVDERAAARADADRLADAIRNDLFGSFGKTESTAAALAAHDDARTKEGPAATLKWVDDTGATQTMAVHVANGLDFIVEYGRLTTDEQRVVVDFFMSEVAARAKEGQ